LPVSFEVPEAWLESVTSPFSRLRSAGALISVLLGTRGQVMMSLSVRPGNEESVQFLEQVRVVPGLAGVLALVLIPRSDQER
jgi:hypothetical protein